RLEAGERGRHGRAASASGGVRPLLRRVSGSQGAEAGGLARGASDLRAGHRGQERDLRDRGSLVGSMGPLAARRPALGGRRGRAVGWVAAHSVSSRPCYRGVVEHSVYVDDEWQGRGIGRELLERLFESTEQDGIWTIQTGVFPENEASLALHEKCGFRVVGTQERLGKLDGVWRDVVVLERRSEVI